MMNTPRSGFNGYRKPPRNDEKAAKLITPRHVMNALRKWWLLAIPIGLLAAATAAALIINTFEPQYMASAWLKIESDQPFVAFPERADSRVFVANQIELIRSPLVLDPVISLPEIARIPEIQESKDPVAWLAQHIQVRSVGGSDLFTISFTCSDGHNAARVVNAIYNAYSAQRGDEEVKRTQRVLDLLKEEQGRRQLELTRLQENVRELAKQAIIKDPLHGRTAANELVQNPLAALQQQRSEREVEVEVLKAKVAAITESFAEKPVEEIGVPAGDLEKAISEDPRIKALETGLAIRQERLRDYAAKLTGYKQDPNYLALAREIDAEKERIAKYREELRPAVEAAYRQSLVQKRQEEVAAMQSQLESLQLAKQMLDERYRREIDTLKQATGESLDVEFMRADLERAGEVYDLITSRILKIETEMRAPERVVLLKEAEPVLNPTTEYPWKPLLLGVVAAFLAPFGLAIGWERLVERISHSEQIEEEAQLPIIGEIASLPRRVKSRPALGSSEKQSVLVYQESFDNLRTLLVLAEELKDAQVLAVTSASNNEGKTSVAVQLAASLARATKDRVLLVDGDMRSPDVHRVLQIPSSPGLADVLAGESTFEDAAASGWRGKRRRAARGAPARSPPHARRRQHAPRRAHAGPRELPLRRHRHAADPRRQRGPRVRKSGRRNPARHHARRQPHRPGPAGLPAARRLGR
jgi:succinoglycan biosynthesis transport protein ExoP